MARTPMVTRTIVSTKCVVLCMNLTEGTPFEQEVTIPRTYSDPKKMLKEVCKLVDSETVKAVHIKSFTEEETLMGMTEAKFMELADVLPPRGTKED